VQYKVGLFSEVVNFILLEIAMYLHTYSCFYYVTDVPRYYRLVLKRYARLSYVGTC
jgi:hypothetical protein